MAVANQSVTGTMQSLGHFGSSYDRFRFDSDGRRCVVWSSINADAKIIRAIDNYSVAALGDDVGYAASFHDDMLAICSSSSIRLYSTSDAAVAPPIVLSVEYSATADQPAALTFDKDGGRLAFGTGSIVQLINVSDGSVAKFKLSDANPLFVGFDSDLRAYLATDYDRETALFSAKNFRTGETVFSTAISPLAFPQMSADGQRVYYSIDKPCYRSEVRSLSSAANTLFLPYSKSMAFCGHDRIVVQILQPSDMLSTQTQSSLLVCWDAIQRAIVGHVEVDSPLLLLAGSSHSDRIAVVRVPTLASPGGRIDVFSVGKLEVVAHVHTGNLAVNAVAISPLGDYLVIGVDGVFMQPGFYQEVLPYELFLAFVN